LTAGVVTALVLSCAVGLALGTLGGGGSILTLPIFVFVAGISAKEAIPMSMVVVGGTSLLGAALHYRRGNFNSKAALFFGLSGMVGAYFGAYLTPLFSERVLLAIFAVLMLIVGVAMLRQKSATSDLEEKCYLVRCVVIGALVGGLTGFVGVGGGFMIVPALVLFAAIPAEQAVGTSLAIIALNAASGFVGQIQKISIDWSLTFGFLGLAILGMLGGMVVADRVRGKRLQKAFGWFIIVLGLLIGGFTATGLSIPSGDS
jgi:hypothetical protein